MIPLNATLELGESTASSMSVNDLLGEDEVETSQKPAAPVGTSESDQEQDQDADQDQEDFDDDGEVVEDAELDRTRHSDEDDEDENEDDGDEEDEEDQEPAEVPDIQTITHLAKYLRGEGFKFTVFNIKGTLINYLEMFGERKVARHVLDQDAHAFYEIHASYIPGGALYRILTRLGFKPMHPTDLNDDYHKDMSYDVAMSNGKLFINIFGGLQQHAHNEETVIRNLYARERMRYAAPLGVSTSSVVEHADERVSKNLLLAAMQSHSIGRTDLSQGFFDQAMASAGIDSLMLTMTEGAEEEDELVIPEDVVDANKGTGDDQTQVQEQQTSESAEGGGTAFEQAQKYVEPKDAIVQNDEESITDEQRVNALSPEGVEIFKAD